MYAYMHSVQSLRKEATPKFPYLIWKLFAQKTFSLTEHPNKFKYALLIIKQNFVPTNYLHINLGNQFTRDYIRVHIIFFQISDKFAIQNFVFKIFFPFFLILTDFRCYDGTGTCWWRMLSKMYVSVYVLIIILDCQATF